MFHVLLPIYSIEAKQYTPRETTHKSRKQPRHKFYRTVREKQLRASCEGPAHFLSFMSLKGMFPKETSKPQASLHIFIVPPQDWRDS